MRKLRVMKAWLKQFDGEPLLPEGFRSIAFRHLRVAIAMVETLETRVDDMEADNVVLLQNYALCKRERDEARAAASEAEDGGEDAGR